MAPVHTHFQDSRVGGCLLSPSLTDCTKTGLSPLTVSPKPFSSRWITTHLCTRPGDTQGNRVAHTGGGHKEKQARHQSKNLLLPENHGVLKGTGTTQNGENTGETGTGQQARNGEGCQDRSSLLLQLHKTEMQTALAHQTQPEGKVAFKEEQQYPHQGAGFPFVCINSSESCQLLLHHQKHLTAPTSCSKTQAQIPQSNTRGLS